VLWGSGVLFVGALASAVGLVVSAPRPQPEVALAAAAPAADPAGTSRAQPLPTDAPIVPAPVPERKRATPTAPEPAPPAAVEDRAEARLRLVLEPAAESAAGTDNAGATDAPQRATSLDSADAAARVNLANRLLASGRVPEARAALGEALRSEPHLAEAHYALGRVLEAAGEGSAAAVEYRLFLRDAAGRWPPLEAAVRERVRLLGGWR
jgi:tetratricopeptide (TPR) repeat protein